MPEDLASPCAKDSAQNDDNLDDTANSDCNVTVIHVSETLAESKDNKDGSDSGVEGCTTEIVQVIYCFFFILNINNLFSTYVIYSIDQRLLWKLQWSR